MKGKGESPLGVAGPDRGIGPESEWRAGASESPLEG